MAPRSRYIKTKINNIEVDYIFQEDIRKELLEHQNRPEGPLFKQDETLVFFNPRETSASIRNLAQPIIINSKWAEKNFENLKNSITAFQQLSNYYTDWNSKFHNWSDLLDLTVPNNFLYGKTENNRKKWASFELLLLSAKSEHALSLDDRRYYWNIFHKSFEPIYYDGSPKFELVNYIPERLISSYQDFLTISDFQNTEELLNRIDVKNFAFQLNHLGLEITPKELDKKLSLMKTNIQNIKKYVFINNINKKSPNTVIQKFTKFQNSFVEKINKDMNIMKINIYQNSEGKFKSKNCYKPNECYEEHLSHDMIIKFLSKQVDKKNNFFIFIEFNQQGINLSKNNFFKYQNKLFVEHSVNSKVILENKNLILMQSKANDWFLIKNSLLENLNIIFIGTNSQLKEKKILNNDEAINENGLTGCVTIYDSKISNVNIKASNNFTCEDTINIVRSFGDIDQIEITNSKSDALDMDFSNIRIKKVFINYAKNDCLDMSWGQYVINKAILLNCEDKAVSVGESSQFKVEKLTVKNSNIGIVSKDSSLSFVNFASFENTNNCFSSYKKKAEFDDAYLQIDYHNCLNK